MPDAQPFNRRPARRSGRVASLVRDGSARRAGPRPRRGPSLRSVQRLPRAAERRTAHRCSEFRSVGSRDRMLAGRGCASRIAAAAATSPSPMPPTTGRVMDDRYASPAVAALAAAQVAIPCACRRDAVSLSRPAYHAWARRRAPAAANVIVIFRADATEEDIARRAEGAADASIVGGPTAADAYLLRVGQPARQLALGRLRADDDVQMAQPIDGAAPVSASVRRFGGRSGLLRWRHSPRRPAAQSCQKSADCPARPANPRHGSRIRADHYRPTGDYGGGYGDRDGPNARRASGAAASPADMA